MNKLVMITHMEGQIEIDESEREWCLLTTVNGDPCSLCGLGFCSDGAGDTSYIFKSVKRGGVTCKECLKIINEIKSYKY
ncbi:hypothetical protein J3U11_09080 [Gilliamella sp. B2840]|uniref:hypothetical protein n=1 Tax=unclassified Gilliamella TaxID=2685620 RepID=UPI0022697F18|nr:MULTISPECIES: hypothetical protein [unclassified Gilliamella]MCX8665347.1 hypothetical protein [Gilliamella sp. B2887]MCX8701221.1 hypothetical protein [Gilliamella sp. B2840]